MKAQLKEVEIQLDLNVVKTPIEGIIQVIQEFNTGDYMPSGIEVLRIIPGNGSDYKIEMIVQNKDISQLQVGQQINYRFLSLPHEEYGTLKGEILKISGDALTNNIQATLAYKIEASINDIKLYDKKGKPAYIKPGMACEARVIVRKKKILYFVLEKINFID